jgi:hypothetical protein
LYGPAGPLAQIETGNNFSPIPGTSEIQFAKNIYRIISVKAGHIQCKNSF